MKYFYRHFPWVYSYSAGALALYGLIEWQRDHYHNIFRYNPGLPVSLILVTAIVGASWLWLLKEDNNV